MLKQGVQDSISVIGAEGCYALSLCRIAEIVNYLLQIDSLGGVVGAIECGVRYGFIKPDMTVLDGAAFLKSLTGKNWTKTWQGAGYKPKEGDYLAAEWYNKRTGKTHFTLEYPQKWNSLSDSVTVKEGAIRSYRLYRVKE